MSDFCVIFDMDGTLLDTQRIYMEGWNEAGARQGLSSLGDHIPYVCGMNDAGWKNYLKERFPTLDVERFHQEVAQYVRTHLKVQFMKGAEEALSFLKEKGIAVAVASGSNTDIVIRHMKALNASHYFNAFIGGDQVQNGKPAPDIFLMAAKSLGYPPEKCYVVEDSPNGIRAGFAAGMKCIGIPDVAVFDEEVCNMMIANLSDLYETIPLFEKEILKA